MLRIFLILVLSSISGFFFGAGMVRHHIVSPIAMDVPWKDVLPFAGEEGQGVPLVDEHPRIHGNNDVPLAGTHPSSSP